MPSTKGQRFWNRIGWLDIEGYGSPPIGLDFKFEVRKIGNVYPSFKASILGLSSANINALTVWNPSDAFKAAREISVFAGYEDDGSPAEICRGYVMRAMPTPPPEMWMNFECMFQLEGKDVVEEPYTMFATIDEIVRQLWAESGIIVSMARSANYNRTSKSLFTFEGSKDLLIERFCDKFGFIAVYEDTSTATIYNRKPWRYSEPDPNRINVINTDTGLLMVGNVDMTGAKVRTRLNDRYGLCEWVRLESRLIPKASGYYFVMEKKHVGHLRGKDWYTELRLVRKG